MYIGIGVSIGAVVKAIKTVFKATFSGGDNNLSMAAADTGQAWTAHIGTWGTIGGEGYCVTDTDGHIISVPSGGTTNYTAIFNIKGDIASGTNSRRAQPIIRFIDQNNFFYISFVGGNVGLRKIDLGASTSPTTVAQTTASDTYYQIKVICNAGSITVYVNNVFKFTYIMDSGAGVGAETTKYGAAGRIGFRYSKSGLPATNARFDNVTVSVP